MRIEDYLISLPIVKKYGARYSSPLIRYKEQGIPDRYLKAWLSCDDTSLHDVWLYYIGVANRKSWEFPSIIKAIARDAGRDFFSEVPDKAQYGISTSDYWERYKTDHLLDWMDADKKFCYKQIKD